MCERCTLCDRYANEEEDDLRNMESSYSQQLKEDAIRYTCYADVMYKVSHKIYIQLYFMFVGRLLSFLYRWKQEWIVYEEDTKTFHSTLTVSPHYLVNQK